MSTNTFMADATPDELVDHDPIAGDPRFDAPASFEGITFASRVHNLMLTMQAIGLSFPELEDFQNGIKRKISPGFRLAFRGGYLVLDEKTRKEWRDFLGRYGKHYFYDSDEQHAELKALMDTPLEEILREHPQFGTANVDSFREIEAAIPPAAGELELILDAALAGDEDELEAIYEAELRGFKRAQVLEAAQKALETLHGRAIEDATSGTPISLAPEPEPDEPDEPESEVDALRARIAELEGDEAKKNMLASGAQPPTTAADLVEEQRRDDPETAGEGDV